MKIAMACDHGGLRLKNVLKDYLEANGYIVEHTAKIVVIILIMQEKQLKRLLVDRAIEGLSYVELVSV